MADLKVGSLVLKLLNMLQLVPSPHLSIANDTNFTMVVLYLVLKERCELNLLIKRG